MARFLEEQQYKNHCRNRRDSRDFGALRVGMHTRQNNKATMGNKLAGPSESTNHGKGLIMKGKDLYY